MQSDHVFSAVYILSTGLVGAATTLVAKGFEVQEGCDCGTLEARIPRSGGQGGAELLAFQSGGGDSQDHTHPSAQQSGLQVEMRTQNVQTGPRGSEFQLGEGFMEEVVFALSLEGQVRLDHWK